MPSIRRRAAGFMPRYKDLEDMYEKHHEKGVEIVDAPCSQFKGHAPGTDWEIHQFCTLHYNTQFPRIKKPAVEKRIYRL